MWATPSTRPPLSASTTRPSTVDPLGATIRPWLVNGSSSVAVKTSPGLLVSVESLVVVRTWMVVSAGKISVRRGAGAGVRDGAGMPGAGAGGGSIRLVSPATGAGFCGGALACSLGGGCLLHPTASSIVMPHTIPARIEYLPMRVVARGCPGRQTARAASKAWNNFLQQRYESIADAATGFEDFLVTDLLRQDASGHVRDAGYAENRDPHVSGDYGLGDSGHSDHVGPDGAQEANLGGGFVAGARDGGIDAFG